MNNFEFCIVILPALVLRWQARDLWILIFELNMKAIQVHQFGPPEVMQYEDVPSLTPNPQEILIEIKAIGVNPVDTYIREGIHYKPSLPFTPGFDAAGIVRAKGKKVKKFEKGDRVYLAGSLKGTYREETLCIEDQVYPLPKNISFEQGAALGIPYATAYRALFQKAKAKKKETLLIHGASGGVGMACLQFAKNLGMKVLATAGTEEGLKLLQSQGAHQSFNHHNPQYLDEITCFTQDKGVDVIVEMLSNVNLDKDLGLLARRGRVIIVGCRGEVTINPRQMMTKETSVIGLTVMSATQEEKEEIHSAIGKGLKKGFLNPIIGRIFLLKDAARAHQAVLKSGALGKIVLRV